MIAELKLAGSRSQKRILSLSSYRPSLGFTEIAVRDCDGGKLQTFHLLSGCVGKCFLCRRVAAV